MRMINTGSVIVDQVIRLPKMPEPGGDVIANSTELVAGGGLNSMLGAARYGMKVVYCGLVGTGPFADIIGQALEKDGISSIFPRVPDADNGYCVAFVEDSAERTFVTTLGVEGDFGYEHLAAIQLEPGDLIYISGYSLATESNAVGLAKWLAEIPADIPVVVDPSPLISELPRELYAPLLARADIWSCNEREAEILGESGSDAANATAIKKLLKKDAAVVVRAGNDPTVVITGAGEVVAVPTFPTVVRDTNGAGDTHVGVMMAALAEGHDLVEAVRRGNAAAAIMISRPGPNTAPQQEEINRVLAGAPIA